MDIRSLRRCGQIRLYGSQWYAGASDTQMQAPRVRTVTHIHTLRSLLRAEGDPVLAARHYVNITG